MPEMAVFHAHDVVRQQPDEMHVVADEDERAFVLLQRHNQRVNTGHVEVCRRLVHQQQVRRIEQQFHQREPAFFAAAQHAHRLEDVVAAKQKAAEDVADGLLGHALRRVERLLQDGVLGIQHRRSVLREIAGLRVVTVLEQAGLRLEDFREQLEQRGFAGAVRSDQHDALAALGLEMKSVVNQFFAVAELDFLQRDDALAAALRLRKPEADRRPVIVRRPDHFLLEPFDLLHLALRLRGLGVLRAEAVHEQLHPVNLALLRFRRGNHRRLRRRALFEILVVISGVAQQVRLPQLGDVRAKAVEKFAVMGNEQDRAGIMAQIFLKPQQRFEVEMVRRLVEQEQIRFLRQQPREMRAHHPAAGKLARRTVVIRQLEAEAVENLLGLGDELPVVLVFVRHGDVEDAFVAGGFAFLRQIAGARAADERHVARVRLLLAEDDFEQSVFARAVRPDDGNAVARHDVQRNVVKQFASAK